MRAEVIKDCGGVSDVVTKLHQIIPSGVVISHTIVFINNQMKQ